MQSLSDRLSTLWSGLPWYAQLFVVGTAIVLFRPRTPEAYQALAKRSPKWFFPRLAALMEFGAGLFADLAKMQSAGKKFVLGTYLTAEEERASKSVPPAPLERGSCRPNLLFSLSGIIALALISCACWFVPVAKTVLDIADRICVIDRIALPDDEVRKLCKIAEPNVPAMRDLLTAKRADAFLSAHRDAGTSEAGALEAGPSDASFDADSH